jgi:hypothetical protein
MAITIAPEVDAQLREKANDAGQDVNIFADALLMATLEAQTRDEEETVEGIRRGLESVAARRTRPAAEVFADMRADVEAIRRGLEACDAGRTRPFAQFAAEMRAKYKLPTYLSDDQMANGPGV